MGELYPQGATVEKNRGKSAAEGSVMKTKLIEILSWALVRRLLVTAVCVGGALFARASVWDDMQEDLAAGLVKFDGGETNWVDGDLVITYTNVTAGGKLVLPKAATARILAVGGGGGGGRVTYKNGTKIKGGGGGGGGAGGVVITNNIILKGEYAIAIGVGGEPGAGGSEVENPGSNGGDTSFTQNSEDVIPRAIGGGGGGACSVGGDGGCGGGGSQTKANVAQSGGLGVEGLGHKGGSGARKRSGGGGGGAGSEGATPTADASGANGGDGIACDISGVATYYGGGGGGGNFYQNLKGKSAGGKGGGGKGLGGRTAGDTTAEERASVNGTDGLGGGGGGGGTYTTAVAGRGGCGTVIVRVTAYGDGVTNTVDAATETNAVESTAADE